MSASEEKVPSLLSGEEGAVAEAVAGGGDEVAPEAGFCGVPDAGEERGEVVGWEVGKAAESEEAGHAVAVTHDEFGEVEVAGDDGPLKPGGEREHMRVCDARCLVSDVEHVVALVSEGNQDQAGDVLVEQELQAATPEGRTQPLSRTASAAKARAARMCSGRSVG